MLFRQARGILIGRLGSNLGFFLLGKRKTISQSAVWTNCRSPRRRGCSGTEITSCTYTPPFKTGRSSVPDVEQVIALLGGKKKKKRKKKRESAGSTRPWKRLYWPIRLWRKMIPIATTDAAHLSYAEANSGFPGHFMGNGQ